MSQPWINRVIIIITLLLLSIYMPTFLKYNNHVRKLVKLSEANESNQELLLKWNVMLRFFYLIMYR